MTKNFQKSMKKKFRKTGTKKKTVTYFVREKTGKKICGLCNGILQGVPHGKKDSEVKKMSKTQ